MKSFEDVAWHQNVMTKKDVKFFEEKVEKGEMIKLTDCSKESSILLNEAASDTDFEDLIKDFHERVIFF